MATHLVTGYAGSEHIKSEDQGSFNASFFGTGQFVMEAGNMLEASIIDNNTVRILDGDLLMKGRHIRINPSTYEDVVIETGTAGVNRCDLIVMEYSKDATTGIEQAYIKVIKGTETTGAATPPTYTAGDILAGATFNQMPLYKVMIEGVVLVDIECLFDTKPTYETLARKYEKEFMKACQTHLDSLGILDTMEEIEANTQDNQLAGAGAVKEMIINLDAYRPKQGFHDDADVLIYAESILGKYDNAFIPISVIGASGSDASYSSGFITTRYDTCSVVLFNYGTSRINVNSRSKDGKWTGWEQAAFYRELSNYLPLSGGELTGSLYIDKPGGGYLTNRISNGVRDVENMLNDSGDYVIYDNTRAETILSSMKDGTVNIPHPTKINGKLPALSNDNCELIHPSEFTNKYGGTLPIYYGMIIIYGSSRPGKFVDDTYYFAIDSAGNAHNGFQCNGETNINWNRKLSVNDITVSGTKLTINLD